MKKSAEDDRNRSGLPDGMRKILAGVGFVTACFLAAFVLVEFHDVYPAVLAAGLLLLAAAYALMNEIVSGRSERWRQELQEEEEDEAFQKKMEQQLESLDKTGKALFAVVKRNAENNEKHLDELEKRLERVVEEQTSTTKTIVKFNKENARQLAINERESLEHAMQEITKTCQETGETVTEAVKEAAQRLSDELSAAGRPGKPSSEPEETAMPEPVILPEAATEPEETAMPEPAILPEAAIEPEEIVIPEPISDPEAVEVIPPEQEEVVTEPEGMEALLDGLSEDPNATLSPDDIARLFASVSQ